MDRCALFVDAGYLLADGAMAVHGTRNRDSVSWDYAGLVQLLNEVARDRTGLPLLRCYWYEATPEGRRTQEQDGIADIPGIKFRAARIRPGRREGVESYVQRDLTTLARTGVLCEAVLVSGDEDMAQVVADVQDLGVRVTVVHISVEGNWTISRALRRECDDLIEIGAGHLRPYVNLLAGAETPEDTVPATARGPLSNGRGRAPSGPVSRQPVTAHAGSSRVEPAPSPASGLDALFAGTGAQPAASGSAMDQLRAMRQSLAQQRGGDHLAPQGSDAMEPRSPNASGPIDTNGFPTGGPPAPPQAAPTGTHASMAPSPPAEPGPGPGHAAPPTGAHPGMRGVAQQGYGGAPQSPPAQPPTGAHRNPLMGGQYEREAPPSRGAPPGPDPRYGPSTGENPGFGGNTGPNPTFGASTGADASFRSAAETHPGLGSATGPHSDHPPVQHGPYTNPTPRVGYVHPGSSAARTVDDAVEVAAREGSDFAESIARDAPVLWLEAVLARRPRMPSDLEARLLQGSTLPIDFLLRDEVRHALRQGFWDALERSRDQ
ncbi:NYN domain-containing protein [Marinitenerispora sediminis]|uniref:Nuclease n=1 Tax=Marinitenerispora sediminis TaxID=1931232 RepID=A0A368T3G2_9ACTN|nr:NYN domain-containing protein [Marinitenerispora sediminis]RCV50386.1 nuclease [Marinitenerispora sediminis]RCV53785.1 nuclease [Marinitenerispora sediminis]RCV56466.1 nuclease [Marinitenerispora sediminis]